MQPTAKRSSGSVVFKLVLLCASVTSTPRSLQVADGVTEEDVVREPGCDNQEIKNKNQKNLKTQEQGKKKLGNRETLLLLLHSSCFLLFYVSSSSGGGGESYSHLKWTGGRRGEEGKKHIKICQMFGGTNVSVTRTRMILGKK